MHARHPVANQAHREEEAAIQSNAKTEGKTRNDLESLKGKGGRFLPEGQQVGWE